MYHSQANVRKRLDHYYRCVNTVILNRQNPTTGLIPASVAVTTHGDYRDAWVRDNVYSIMAVFGLALAYRRIDDDEGRAYELEHAVIKLMRGLLFSMMRQVHKVEQFKKTQALNDCLHAKYNTATGDTVVGDSEWGHLQIDATSIFLLALAQMTASGMLIVYTADEVDFIQNLVFYIERAYRTPDYGIWERGNKINHGEPELNSSSIGMAVAALQAINGINLFGSRGGPSSVIHVLPDEITRNYTTLHSALPRESNSKEIDAALLSVIGFPAFAVGDAKLVERTRNEIIEKLGGKYGCKRFLRDGHQTVLENTSRLHYDAHELQIFEGIECEWPLFYTYFILDGLFSDNEEQVEEYRAKLEPLIIDSATLVDFGQFLSDSMSDSEDSRGLKTPTSPGFASPGSDGKLPEHIPLIPELYFVPNHLVDAEKKNKHSQARIANDNLPLVWANSLHTLGNLIYENLLSVAEIDPLGRRFNARKTQPNDTVVQIVLLAEDANLQSMLNMYGLETQTMDQVHPITVSHPQGLKEVYGALGRNAKLGLSGRPKRPIGSLGTSRLYRVQGHLYAFTPHFMDNEEFYLTSDNDYLISIFEQELAFVRQYWVPPGRPTMTILLTHAMLGGLSKSRSFASQMDADGRQLTTWRKASLGSGPQKDNKRNLLNFFMTLRSGICNGVRVRLGRLSEMVNTSCIESLDFLVAKKDIDWLGILRGAADRRKGRNARKLGLNEKQTQAATPGTRTPSHRWSMRRRSSSFAIGLTLASLTTPSGNSDHDGDSYFGSQSQTPLEPSFPASPLFMTPSRPDTQDPYATKRSKKDQAKAFKLKDHEEPRPKGKNPGSGSGSGALTPDLANLQISEAPSSDATQDEDEDSDESADGMDSLGLTLGDPSQMEAAMSMLSLSVNLYDQIDLLQYLLSCQDMDFYVSNLDATVQTLLEEVYFKSLQLKLWSIVRQAAGLLHKVVNSLTINITDLVIRQKQITIGSGPTEHFITTPLGPDVLSGMIYDGNFDDVREGPVVQEVLIYLGSFVRADPAMFEGIMRLRTHFLIIALREEISRLNSCDETDAVEHLMQLSPFELKSLLGTVLSGPTLSANATNMLLRNQSSSRLSPISGRRHAGNISLTDATDCNVTPNIASSGPSMSLGAVPIPNMSAGSTTLTIKVQSGGYHSGNFSKILINESTMSVSSRGINVVAIDPVQGVLIESVSFDTHISEDESDDLARLVDWLHPGMIVICSGKDDSFEHLTTAARLALKQLGSGKINDIKYRDSWCMIGEKGIEAGKAVEAHKSFMDGPTDVIEKTFDLDLYKAKADSLDPFPSPSAIAAFVPNSSGRWLRRRKNDGSLNRVPTKFYPRVWRILSRAAGIRIGSHLLPRDPIVSEKTAEEFNFALAVENFLDVIIDPAERQIAVETLMVIAKIEDRSPGMEVQPEVIDLPLIMREAMNTFWTKWVVNGPGGQGQAGVGGAPVVVATDATAAGGIEKGDVSFEHHEQLARRMFYDLPPEGKEGTFAYLARAVFKLLPYSIDLE
ncbi:glycosyl hydrolases family 15-domain-containing protein [Dissophora ornata]|nr:glycosyl hydrolases family 15-domain-containing protein [Dissophora ornata]